MAWAVGDLVWAPRSAKRWSAAVVSAVSRPRVVRVMFYLGLPVEANRRSEQLVLRDPLQGGLDKPIEIPYVWAGMNIGFGEETLKHG